MEVIRKQRNRILRILSLAIVVMGIMLMLYPLFTTMVSIMAQRNLTESLGMTELPEALAAENNSSGDGTIAPPSVSEFKGAILEIPAINLTCAVQKGTSRDILDKGPGWYVESALPGLGNTAIASHRSMYGGWFGNINKLKEGDLIFLHHQGYTYCYKVTQLFKVDVNDWSIINPTKEPVLTLTTCVAWDIKHRFVVRSELIFCSRNE